ncbi:MAG: hypothetical protein A2172_02580 [Candidatus Woykebacteria bacterium RBG_13_40_15]|uniref:Uncharacterized protein n=1 Tax=Candidatus Woykebacteria bacterium RBG_13_40_15 TaxID=1802593 RepID=A0A1G1W6E5_9BACT|nr:MAG: hypothetical protein A2172_02580 [Candidatus Woykebacteria bacterium RBG_13_40_15]
MQVVGSNLRLKVFDCSLLPANHPRIPKHRRVWGRILPKHRDRQRTAGAERENQVGDETFLIWVLGISLAVLASGVAFRAFCYPRVKNVACLVRLLDKRKEESHALAFIREVYAPAAYLAAKERSKKGHPWGKQCDRWRILEEEITANGWVRITEVHIALTRIHEAITKKFGCYIQVTDADKSGKKPYIYLSWTNCIYGDSS